MNTSLAWRAVLAVVLMLGFYLLALGLAGGLLYIPYAEAVYANRVHIKLAFICVAGAGIILWSILPRIDRFEAPGPLLTKKEQPRLFEALEGIASKTQQAMPVEVYLVADINAWVSSRGGVMGFGSRRIMGLGLPLMQLLTVSELKAVLAHEFGHYHGGDTSLGPWIYKTRAALGRTIMNLHQAESLIKKPFEWYGKLFLRITHAISRRQELAADALAARTVGPEPLISGLKRVHAGALAFDAYWRNEYAPVVNAGFRPPLAEGFSQFMGARDLAAALDKAVVDELEHGTSDPYDTHPPLRERVEALAGFNGGGTDDDRRPAVQLLDALPEAERRLLASLSSEEIVASLTAVDWGSVGSTVLAPMWREAIRADAEVLAPFTPATLPEGSAALVELGHRLAARVGESVDDEAAAGHATGRLGAAMCVMLLDEGFEISSPPGEAVMLRRGEHELAPFRDVSALYAGELSREDWLARVSAAGVAQAALASAPAPGDAG